MQGTQQESRIWIEADGAGVTAGIALWKRPVRNGGDWRRSKST